MASSPAQALSSPVVIAQHGLETDETAWKPLMELSCHLSVQIPLPSFRVRDFLGLRPGSVIASAWRLSSDVPLRINGTLVGWGELEQAGKHLAVRLTELA